MSDTQQRKDLRETYPTSSASEDDEATLRPTMKISPPSEAGDRAPDTETFSITAATHLGEESATQGEPAAETTHPHESQPMAKGAKQLRGA